MKKRQTSLLRAGLLTIMSVFQLLYVQMHAQSVRGNPVPCHAATSELHISRPLGISYVSDPAKAVDKSTNSASHLHTAPGNPSAYSKQTLIFDLRGQSSDTARILLSFPYAITNPSQISNISLVATLESRLYSDSAAITSGGSITLTWSSPSSVLVSYIVNLPFDRVEVWLNTPATGQVSDVYIHYASKNLPEPDLYDAHLRACSGDRVTFKANAPADAVYRWYSQPTGGTRVHTGKSFTTPSITTNTVFYAEAVSFGCVSPRTPAYVQVQPDMGIAELWNQNYTGPFDDQLRTAIPSVNGGFLLGGTSNLDLRVIHVNQRGKVIWDKTYGGSSYDELFSLVPTADGGYLLGGYTSSSDGVFTDGNNGYYDFFVIKIDASGNVLWNKTYGGSNADNLFAITPASGGGFVLAGTTSSSDQDVTDGRNGFVDYWVVRIDANGNKLWDKTFGGSGLNYLQDIVPASDGGGYILAGYTDSSDGDVTDPNNGQYDAWLVRIDANGNKIWDRTYGGSGYEILSDIAAEPDGGYVFGGLTSSNDGDISDGADIGGDGLVFKIDVAGNKVWDRTLGGNDGDNFTSVLPLPDGGYLLGGYTYSNENGDVSDFNQGELDIWVARLDSSRSKLWDATFGGTQDDLLSKVLPLGPNQYLLAGYLQSFDGDLTGKNESIDLYLSDFWLIAIREIQCNNNCKIALDQPTTSEDILAVYPNPFSAQVTLTLKEASGEAASFKLFDINGKELLMEAIPGNSRDILINTSKLEPGLYILKAFVGDKIYVKKITKF